MLIRLYLANENGCEVLIFTPFGSTFKLAFLTAYQRKAYKHANSFVTAGLAQFSTHRANGTTPRIPTLPLTY